MSMQQALGAVGFVVGSYFGYPQLGFVVGSLVGSALTPAQKVEGPRIDDQKVTVSTEGSGIPRVWGTVRLGGNVIESTDKMEVSTTESQGKGGGGVESTTYRYYVNIRTLLCEAREGASYAVRKIWKDGKLIYDASLGTSVGSALASAENPAASLIVYAGGENQLPDPTEEARYGVGNVLAYRGVVSVVMNNVECPGGRVPQFSFELCVDPVASVDLKAYGSAPRTGDFQQATAVIKSDLIWHYNQTRTLTGRNLSVWNVGPAWSGKVNEIIVPLHSNGAFIATPINSRSASPEALIPDFKFPETQYFYAVSLEGGMSTIFEGRMPIGLENHYGGPGTIAAHDQMTGSYAVGIVGEDTSSVVVLRGGSSVIPLQSYGELAQVAQIGFGRGMLQVILWLDGRLRMVTFNDDLEVSSDLLGPQAHAPSDTAYAQFNAGTPAFLRYRIDAVSYTIFSIGNTWSELATTAGPTTPSFVPSTMWASETGALVGPNDSGFVAVPAEYSLIQYQSLTPRAVDVSAIVEEECMRAGLSQAQIGVSGIEHFVHGYTISNPASARAGIQPLMTAFAIDAADEDGKLSFFSRSDKASVSTIGYDELGCVEEGSEPGDPMPLTRANETELYRSVTVSYINPDFDYQTSTEIARRQVTGATVDYSVEIAIAMSADQAATAAHRILYDNHNDRNRRSVKLSRKDAYVSAGDVTTVEYPRGNLSDWRWVQATDTGALIEVEMVPADAELYAQTAVGGAGRRGQEVAPLPPPTRVVVMEGMPILRDADDDAGVYVALQALGSTGYRGSTLLVGDADSVLEPRGSVTRSATIGFSESAYVGPAVGFGFVDNTTQLVVNVGSGELHSATWEAMIVGGANVAALSVSYEVNGFPDALWEVFQFREATPLGNGRYLLTGLLRGLRGTEQVAYHHQVGDRFVLLNNAGMLHVSLEAGGIGSTKFYRGVSVGRSASTVDSATAESTGYGLRPFSPVNVRRRSVSGAVVWTWDRRTRMQTNWQRGIVPLGEGSEAYEVVIYNDFFYTRIVRVIRAYAPTATYSAGEVLADGYTASGPIPYRIYQLSATVGRGIPYQPNQGLI